MSTRQSTPSQRDGHLPPHPRPTIIDNLEGMVRLVDDLDGLPYHPPSYYFRLEGVNVSRAASISIISLHIKPAHKTYLIDIRKLKDKAFETHGSRDQSKSRTLKRILEDDTTIKVFFDVRNASDALYHLYGITLRGVHDLQLMEVASRKVPGRHVMGLAKCIQSCPNLSDADKTFQRNVERLATSLFSQKPGGGREILDERPLSDRVILCCTYEVEFFWRMWEYYNAGLDDFWGHWKTQASFDRALESQSNGSRASGLGRSPIQRVWERMARRVLPSDASALDMHFEQASEHHRSLGLPWGVYGQLERLIGQRLEQPPALGYDTLESGFEADADA